MLFSFFGECQSSLIEQKRGRGIDLGMSTLDKAWSQRGWHRLDDDVNLLLQARKGPFTSFVEKLSFRDKSRPCI